MKRQNTSDARNFSDFINTITVDTNKNGYRLRIYVSAVRSSQKAKRYEASGYETRLEAEGEKGLFAFAILHDRCRFWCSPAQREKYKNSINEIDQTRLLKFQQLYEQPYNARAKIKIPKPLAALNAVQETSFMNAKLAKKAEGEKITKEQFLSWLESSDYDALDKARMKKSAMRTKRSTKPIKTKEQYLKDKRVILERRLAGYKVQTSLLLSAMKDGTEHHLLARDDEERAPGSPLDMEDVHPRQLAKIKSQCHIVWKVLKKLIIKAEEEREKIEETLRICERARPVAVHRLDAATLSKINSAIDAHYEWKKTFSGKEAMPLLIACAHAENIEWMPREIRPSTLSDWYYDFANTQEGKGFSEDKRGKNNSRTNFLERNELAAKFTLWMSLCKSLSVDEARIYLNQIICVDDRDRLETAEGRVMTPISRDTAHRWMLACGASYDEHKSSYYTDTHESVENKNDRTERFIPAHLNLLLRMPQWVSVPIASASDASLEHLRACLQLKADADVHAYLSEHAPGINRQEGTIKVHIDFLTEAKGEQYQQAMMRAFGRPGDYFFETREETDNKTGALYEMLIIPVRLEPLIACKASHFHESCQTCYCSRPVLKFGQDESCFAAYALSKNVWRINKQTRMRKKTKGQGLMVSAFVNGTNGFGLRLDAAQLQAINEQRGRKGKQALKDSPGLQFFEIGASKEGYWNHAKFKEQVRRRIEEGRKQY